MLALVESAALLDVPLPQPGRALGCPSALLSRMLIALTVGFNRDAVEIRRPFVPQGWRKVHWAQKRQ